MHWENPSFKLPDTHQRVVVLVKMKYGGNKQTTIAEYVPKHTEPAEDYIDSDYCDPDYFDVGEDGVEYTPEGWYECPIESDVGYCISGEVLYWMKIPASPYI